MPSLRNGAQACSRSAVVGNVAAQPFRRLPYACVVTSKLVWPDFGRAAIIGLLPCIYFGASTCSRRPLRPGGKLTVNTATAKPLFKAGLQQQAATGNSPGCIDCLVTFMHTLLAKILLLLAAFTVAVPESYAKRAGSGRSAGRQSQMTKQKTAPPPVSRTQPAPPPPSPAPMQRAQPDTARQPAPPLTPAQTLPRQASTPWGGMLGGALIGLGLGSLIGAGDRNPNTVEQSEGGNGAAGSSASGAGETQANAAQARENRVGPLLLFGILALAVFFLARRSRRRAHRH